MIVLMRRRLVLLLFLCVALSSLTCSAAPSDNWFTYRRVFKSSVPEFIEIRIQENGNTATYEIRQLDEDAGASPFEVGPALRGKIFQLVSELHYFKGLDLDIHRRIANLGEKTFRWDSAGAFSEVKFNYTMSAPATQLLQICEGLARQQELIELLQRRMKYDRLGVNDALLQFESDLDKGELPEPQRALPLLEQIAGDARFVEIARQRSRALAERLRHWPQ
jgi:hypothetical protein